MNKLTAEKARAIYLASGLQSRIAAEFGCGQMTVSFIKRRKWWKAATEGLAPVVIGPTLEEIDAAVCERFKIKPELLHGRRRNRIFLRPRQIAMYLARNLAGASYPKIGSHYDRDHTTAISSIRRIAYLRTTKPKVAQYIADLEAVLAPAEMREAA